MGGVEREVGEGGGEEERWVQVERGWKRRVRAERGRKRWVRKRGGRGGGREVDGVEREVGKGGEKRGGYRWGGNGRGG